MTAPAALTMTAVSVPASRAGGIFILTACFPGFRTESGVVTSGVILEQNRTEDESSE